MSKIFLKSSNLSLGYSNQIVIKGLDIQLSFINDYQIIGKNGAGKTTLMNFIALNFDGSYFDGSFFDGSSFDGSFFSNSTHF